MYEDLRSQKHPLPDFSLLIWARALQFFFIFGFYKGKLAKNEPNDTKFNMQTYKKREKQHKN